MQHLPAHLSNSCDFPCRKAYCPEAVRKNEDPASYGFGRYFITIGHRNFNSRANNGAGYATEAAANRASMRDAEPVWHSAGLVTFGGAV